MQGKIIEVGGHRAEAFAAEHYGAFHRFDNFRLDPRCDPPRTIQIFLPGSYDSGDTLPVVYMNDGHTAFYNSPMSGQSLSVHKTIDDLHRKGEAEPVIVVGVHPVDRGHEYLHVIEFDSPFKRKGGGLGDYAKYLVRLKNFVDAHYATMRQPEFTAISGSSHGGLAAFYTACVHSAAFGIGGCMSSSFWAGGVFNIRECYLAGILRERLQLDRSKGPKLWIDWGAKRSGGFHNFAIEAQSAKWSKEVVKLLREDYGFILNHDLFAYEDPLGGHQEISWEWRFRLFMKQFYGK